jgi:hypothetical protein
MAIAIFFAVQPNVLGRSITGSAVDTNFVSGMCVDAVITDIVSPTSVSGIGCG